MSSVSAEKREAFMEEYSLENKEQFFDEMAYQLRMFGITEFQKSSEFIDALVRSYQGAYVTQSPIGVLPEALDVSLLPAALVIVDEVEADANLKSSVLNKYFEEVIRQFYCNISVGYDHVAQIQFVKDGGNDGGISAQKDP